MDKLKIEYVKLEDLKPWSGNPRTISDHDAKALRNSIESFGMVEPIVINHDNEVIGGHQRLKAIKELGGTEAPVIRVNLKDQEAKALNIALNRISGDWEYDLLKEALGEMSIEFQELTGFDSGELDGLLEPEFTGDIDLDDIPEMSRETDVKLGDIYQLGNHRLMCGDSTSKEDVERLMDGDKADMVFTDPPYGVGYDGGDMNPREKIKGDDSTELYKFACKMAFEFSAEKAAFYLWHAGVKGLAAAAAAAAAGYVIRSEIIWNKNNAQWGALSAQYKQKHEPAYYCYKKNKTINWYGGKSENTVWDCDRANKNEFHPTQKPVALAERAIKNSSKRTDIILDLFGGSGSTLIACEQLDRHCYMMEIDPYYCDVIIKRWENLTDKTAEKIDVL